MEKRRLGRTDIDVSVLCLGTMMYGDQLDEATSFTQMDTAFDRGINFFDSAELYTVPPKAETQGESERIVGRWMKDRGRRSDIILATKVVGRTMMPWIREGTCRHTREQIEMAIDRSLQNLQTEYIDLYQLHWPDRKVALFGNQFGQYRHYDEDYAPFDEILGVLADLQKAGKVRHFGLSNETPYGTMKFVQHSEQDTLPRMQSIQNAYNLINREFELGLAEIAMQEQVGLLAYSPMAQGVLSGKYLDGNLPKGSRGQLFGRLDRYQTPSAEKAIRAYVALAQEFGHDPSAFANQFVTTRPFLTSNIFGASTPEQLETALTSVDIPWTEEMDRAVDDIHRELPNPCP